jgi:peptide/nickel transport system ATP-binding protein
VAPRVLLADEAVSALDVTVRGAVLDLLDELVAEQGLTLVFVSHDLGVVRALCDRVIVMHAGRVIEQGPTERVFSAPEQAYTAELLDAMPVLPGA